MSDQAQRPSPLGDLLDVQDIVGSNETAAQESVFDFLQNAYECYPQASQGKDLLRGGTYTFEWLMM